MESRMRRYLLFAVPLFLFNMVAQDLRSVRGLISDQKGTPLPGAVVELKDRKTLQIRSFITQGDGKYHFSGLNADDDYTLTAKYHEIWSGKKHLSQYDSRKDAIVNLTQPVRGY